MSVPHISQLLSADEAFLYVHWATQQLQSHATASRQQHAQQSSMTSKPMKALMFLSHATQIALSIYGRGGSRDSLGESLRSAAERALSLGGLPCPGGEGQWSMQSAVQQVTEDRHRQLKQELESLASEAQGRIPTDRLIMLAQCVTTLRGYESDLELRAKCVLNVEAPCYHSSTAAEVCPHCLPVPCAHETQCMGYDAGWLRRWSSMLTPPTTLTQIQTLPMAALPTALSTR